jgi:rhodanese-related sulfurtransferase
VISEIDSAGLQEKIAAGEDIHLVDIRTPAEVAQAAIPDAVHLPMHLLPLRMTELPKDKEVVLYCRSGARSYHACTYLVQQGFDNVINLRGGIIAWARHGFEIAQGGGR